MPTPDFVLFLYQADIVQVNFQENQYGFLA
jgi:hypothetical protein